MRCPTNDQLSRYLGETFAAGQAEVVTCHVEACSDCQDRLEKLTSIAVPGIGLRFEAAEPVRSSAVLERLMQQLVTVDFTRLPDSSETHRGNVATPHARAASSDLLPDASLPNVIGRYRLLKRLGRGGTGTLYEATDTLRGRVVALKIMHEWLTVSPNAIKRMQREASAAARVRHPGVVSVLEFVVEPDMAPMLVMERLSGVTLGDLIRNGSLTSTKSSAKLLAGAVRGVAALHEAGLIHRDIKPSNLLLDDESDRNEKRLVVADLGLIRDEGATADLTHTENLLGTPAFMSPEQIHQPNRVDQRSDVYSFGCVLYQMLTTRPPFEGSTRMVLWQATHEDPRPPRLLSEHVDRDVETICLKAMARRPADRYPTALELAEDLERYASGKRIHARPAGLLKRALRWTARHRGLAIAGLSTAVMLMGITIASLVAARSMAIARAEATDARNRAVASEQRAVGQAAEAVKNQKIAKQQSELVLSTLASVVSTMTDELERLPGSSLVRQKVLKTSMESFELASQGLIDSNSVDLQTAIAIEKMSRIVMSAGSPRERQLLTSLIPEQLRSDVPDDASAMALGGKLARRSLEISEHLMSRRPDDPKIIAHYGRSLQSSSEINIRLGKFDTALELCLKWVAESERLLSFPGYEVQAKHKLTWAYHRIAEIYEQQGDLDKTLHYHRECLNVCRQTAAAGGLGPFADRFQDLLMATLPEEVVREIPSGKDLGAHTSLFYILIRYGRLLERSGDHAAAVAAWKEARERGAILVTGRDVIEQPISKLCDIHFENALLDQLLGDVDAAIVSLQRAIVISEEIVRQLPEDVPHLTVLSTRYERLGDLYRETRDTAAAQTQYVKSVAAAGKLYELNATDVSAAMRVIDLNKKVAEVSRVNDDLQTEEAAVRAALEFARQVKDAEPQHAKIDEIIATLESQVGNF